MRTIQDVIRGSSTITRMIYKVRTKDDRQCMIGDRQYMIDLKMRMIFQRSSQQFAEILAKTKHLDSRGELLNQTIDER